MSELDVNREALQTNIIDKPNAIGIIQRDWANADRLINIGNSAKLRDEEKTGTEPYTPMTIEILRPRKKAYFEQNANIVPLGNEFVIAMRHHKGPFPVYAYYDGGTLKCFPSVDGKRVENGKTISALGKASWC